MKNTFFSFLMGGVFFSIIIMSTASQQAETVGKWEEIGSEKSYHNRYYELRDQLKKMEVDFARFYRKPKKATGNRLRDELERLKYLTESIQRDIFQLKEKRKPLIGKK